MMRALILALACLATAVHAQERNPVERCCYVHPTPAAPQDRWGDTDHQWIHFAGTAAISGVVTAAFDDRRIGFAAGLIVGLAREQWKRTHGYASYSTARLTVDVAGSAFGAQVGNCMVGGESINCLWTF